MPQENIFGDNLRLLVALRGSQAATARALDLGNVQLRRYLTGESQPSPAILKRICDHFGVDARIYLERIDGDLMRDMAAPAEPLPVLDYQREWLAGLGFAAGPVDYFHGPHRLPNGLYAIWRWSVARPGRVLRVLNRVFEADGLKLIRGIDPPEIYPPDTPAPLREFRGLCLNLGGGYAILTFSADHVRVMSNLYISTPETRGEGGRLFTGFNFYTRDEIPNVPRVSRVLAERLATTPADLVRHAHAPHYYRPEDVPDDIQRELRRPMD